MKPRFKRSLRTYSAHHTPKLKLFFSFVFSFFCFPFKDFEPYLEPTASEPYLLSSSLSPSIFSDLKPSPSPSNSDEKPSPHPSTLVLAVVILSRRLGYLRSSVR